MTDPTAATGPCAPGRLALIVAGALLSACNLGPHYVRPDIPAPAAWTPVTPESTPSQPRPAEPSTWPDAQWWHAFASPDLDRLMDQAQQANDDLQAAVARVEQSDAQVRIAGAPLLPALQAGFTPARQRMILPNGTNQAISITTFTAQLSAAYELDFWGRNAALRAAAVAQDFGSRYDRETVQLSLMASVATTYFTALSLRDRVEVATNNLANARETLRGLQFEQQVGTATALDVAQQQSLVDTEDAAVPALRAQLSHTLAALAILVGTTPDQLQLGQTTLEGVTAPPVVTGLPAGLLTRRPDVASAEAQLVAANANVRAARAAFLPTIQLTASGGVQSSALSTLLLPGSRIFDIGAGITQPIFEGGQLAGAYAQSKGRYRELLADYHKAVISAFGNTQDSLTEVHESAEQQLRQERATQTARRAYDFSQQQFHAGTINILTVLTTETALLTAQDTQAQVRLAHLTALVSLYQALGGGWDTQQERRE
ncbi:MAG TPA: efflux transporter outer membrane subunit [Steroidobacteraceae bacterium]|jgi:multidrug efflux system outer membrane protein|nr:efflux transporter outer membrane subunit [Steroidobacteraceae bacterium]